MSAVQRYRYPNTIVLGPQDVVNLNHLQTPFNASIFVDIVSGTARYSIEFTTDDLTNTPPAQQRWNAIRDFPPGQTKSLQYTLQDSVTAVRLNLAANEGEVRFCVIQGIGLFR